MLNAAFALVLLLANIMAPSAWTLFVFSVRLLPITGSFTADDLRDPDKQAAYDRALAYRVELAQACEEATEDRSERYICVQIARYESNFREDVGRCRVIGKSNDRTAWQIVPRNAAESERLCVSLVNDARFALERVRESRAACKHLPKTDQLAIYTRGACNSEEGRALSRHRFPSDALVRKVETEKW